MAFEILENGADPSTMKVEEVSKTTKMWNPDICGKYYITVSDDYVSVFD